MSDSSRSDDDARNRLDALFMLAVTEHRAGHVAEAEKLYRRVVDQAPGHGLAQHNLGAIAWARGDLSAAVPLYRAATAALPEREAFWLAYADAALAASRIPEAREALRSASAAGHDTPGLEAMRQRVEQAANELGIADDANSVPVAEDHDAAAAKAEAMIGLINGGQFAEAERLGRTLVAHFPDFGLTWKLLGVAIQVQGGQALPALRRATELLPDDPDTQLNLGAALLAGDDLAGAEQCFRAAIRIAPDIHEPYANLALVLDRLKRPLEVIECCRQVERLVPADQDNLIRRAVAHEDAGQLDAAAETYRRAAALGPLPVNSLVQYGSVLNGLKDYAGAFACYRTALGIQPDNPETHRLLGDALLNSGDAAGAETSYAAALALKPQLVAARLNLGTSLNRQGKLREAAEAFRLALDAAPRAPATAALAASNLSATLYKLGELESAVDHARRATDLDPGAPLAHLNLSAALFDRGQVEEALVACRRALQLRPEYAAAHRNLGDILVEGGDVADGIAHYRRALELNESDFSARQSLLFALNFLGPDPACDAALVEAVRFADQVRLLARPFREWPNRLEPNRQLRVGLVSGDLFAHPVGVFLEGALRDFDDASIEFVAYYNHYKEDEQTARLRSLIPQWRSILNQSDAEVAERIRADGIDILIDLSGHTSRNRLPLFAWRAAPLQATWLGYFATTGMTEIDRFITDRWVMPPGGESALVERPLRLPDCFLCYVPPEADLLPGPCPRESAGRVTFGCFNNITKINDDVVDSWSAILNAVPDSRLFLKSRQFSGDAARDSIHRRFRRHGLGGERLVLEGQSPRDAYFAAYRQVDLALDPFPYTGGTTTLDALWMGVPTVTLSTASLLGRQGESILRTAGLPELVTTTRSDYIAQAVTLAADAERLPRLRATLRDRLLRSPLCDSRRYGAGLAAGLREMWVAHCAAAESGR